MSNPVKTAPTETLEKLGSKYYNIKNPTPTEMTMFNLIVAELKKRLTKAEFEVWAINA